MENYFKIFHNILPICIITVKPESRVDNAKVNYNKSNGHISISSLEDGRPDSGDSGINSVSPTSHSSVKSLTGISVHASDENLSQNVSNYGYAHNDPLSFRQLRLEQAQWRSAMQAGRNYQ